MENEKNLNEKSTAQELPDESLDAVAGGGERYISDLKYSYPEGCFVWAKVPKEECPAQCVILKTTYVRDSHGYYAAYKVRYRSAKHKRLLTNIIRQDDILQRC